MTKMSLEKTGETRGLGFILTQTDLGSHFLGKNLNIFVTYFTKYCLINRFHFKVIAYDF